MKHFLLTILALLCAATALGQTVWYDDTEGGRHHYLGFVSTAGTYSDNAEVSVHYEYITSDGDDPDDDNWSNLTNEVYIGSIGCGGSLTNKSITILPTITDPLGRNFNVVNAIIRGGSSSQGTWNGNLAGYHLEEITVLDGLRQVGLDRCKNLKTITLPSTLAPDIHTTDIFALIYNCPALETVKYGASDYAGGLWNLRSLKNIYFPTNYKCLGYLQELPEWEGPLVIPESCTLFNGIIECPKLKGIEFPSTIESNPNNYVKYPNVSNCPGLEYIVWKDPDPTHVGGMHTNFETCILYVPFGCRDTFKSMAPWNKFKHIYEGTPHAYKSLFLGEEYTAELYGLKYNITITQEQDSPNGKGWECRVNYVYGTMPQSYTLPEELKCEGQTIRITEWAANAFTTRLPNYWGWDGDQNLITDDFTELRIPAHTHTLPAGLFGYEYYYHTLRKVYADTPDPQPLPDGVFCSETYSSGMLIVGDGRVGKFAQAEGWNRFSVIRGTSGSPDDPWELYDRDSGKSGRYQWNDDRTGALYGNLPGTPLIGTTVYIPYSAGVDDEGNYIPVTGLAPEAFKGCTDLQHIALHEEITKIGDRAFEGCTGLEDLVIQGETMPAVGEDAFKDINPDARLWVPIGQVPDYLANEDYSSAFGDRVFGGGPSNGTISAMTPLAAGEDAPTVELCYYKEDSYVYNEETGDYEVTGSQLHMYSLTVYTYDEENGYTSRRLSDAVTGDITLPDAINGWPIVGISSGVFSGNTALTSMQLPAGVKYIDSYAFSDCTALKSITLPDGLTELGKGAFEGCTALSAITLPESLEEISDYAFWGCNALTEIKLPAGLQKLGTYALSECTALKEVDMSACTKIEILNEGVFAASTALESVTLPESVWKIDNYAFSGCTAIANLTLPENLYTIGSYAFNGCTALKSIELPHGVSVISNQAFQNCTSLESITLSEDLYSIGNQAFFGCTALKDVVNLRPEPILIYYLYTFSPETYEQATLWVPEGSHDAYADIEQSGYWTNFLTIKEGNPTGIHGISTVNGKWSTVYDLQGRKVESSEKSGIYIIGKKKVLVR